MTHISLPNGTVINLRTIISVKAFLERKSAAYHNGKAGASVVVIFNPCPSQSFHETIECETDQEAIDLRDRIIARLNESTPIIPV